MEIRKDIEALLNVVRPPEITSRALRPVAHAEDRQQADSFEAQSQSGCPPA